MTDTPPPLTDQPVRVLRDLIERSGKTPDDDDALDTLLAEIEQLARDVISLAEDGGMPDSYQQTDQRMIRARAALTEQEDE